MWVWSDELAERFPEIRSNEGRNVPLVAYSFEHGANLEEFARNILGPAPKLRDSLGSEANSPSTSAR